MSSKIYFILNDLVNAGYLDLTTAFKVCVASTEEELTSIVLSFHTGDSADIEHAKTFTKALQASLQGRDKNCVLYYIALTAYDAGLCDKDFVTAARDAYTNSINTTSEKPLDDISSVMESIDFPNIVSNICSASGISMNDDDLGKVKDMVQDILHNKDILSTLGNIRI